MWLGAKDKGVTMATSDAIKTRASRLSGFLGLQRSTVGMLAMVVLVGMGERMAERFLPIYIMALAMTVAALFLQQRMIADDRPERVSSGDSCPLTPEKNPIKLLRIMNPAMKRLLVTDILIRFCEQIPYAFVVVWSMKVIAEPVSALQFGWLTAIEMATAVLVYIPVAYLADRTTKKPFVLITFGFFTLFPLVLLFSHSLRMVDGSLCPAGAQGVRRAHPQVPDHGSGAGNLPSRHVRALLPDPGCCRIPGRFRRGDALANQPGDQSGDRLCLRDHRHGRFRGLRPRHPVACI